MEESSIYIEVTQTKRIILITLPFLVFWLLSNVFVSLCIVIFALQNTVNAIVVYQVFVITLLFKKMLFNPNEIRLSDFNIVSSNQHQCESESIYLFAKLSVQLSIKVKTKWK